MRKCGHCGADISARSARAKSCSQRCNMALWRAANPDKIDEARASARAGMQRWRDADPERARAAGAARRADPAYQEAARRRTREWSERNPARARDGRRRRKARIRGGGVFRLTERDWQRLCARYRYCCAYCGVKPDQPLQREHVIPISRGGRHSAGNILPACSRCNFAKGAKLLSEWRYRGRGVMPHLIPDRIQAAARA